MTFLVVSNWHEFKTQTGRTPHETVFTSPVLATPISWSELIPSWNIRTAGSVTVEVQVRPVYADRASDFFHLGVWSKVADDRHPRHSVRGQVNDIGSVATDTLRVKHPSGQVQLRLVVADHTQVHVRPPIDFFGLDLWAGPPSNLHSDLPRSGLGRVVPVPTRSQLSHPSGREWCSPTSVSMVLAYWAARLKRPELDVSVADTAAAVHDPSWPGTGNWPFNTAYAGSFPGIQARVARMTNTAELNAWLQADVPPIVSVSFDLLNGKARDEGTGHLVVCVGTTDDGQFVLNDPFARTEKGESVRRVVSNETLARAWQRSSGVVYLIHPENWPVPGR